MNKVRRTLMIGEQQNYELEEWKWKYKMSCSQIIRQILSYYMKNPDKLKEVIVNGKKNKGKHN